MLICRIQQLSAKLSENQRENNNNIHCCVSSGQQRAACCVWMDTVELAAAVTMKTITTKISGKNNRRVTATKKCIYVSAEHLSKANVFWCFFHLFVMFSLLAAHSSSPQKWVLLLSLHACVRIVCFADFLKFGALFL